VFFLGGYVKMLATMKVLGKLVLIIILLIIIIPIFILGFFGFIPGLSNLFGANKPKDLGITYSPADLTSVRSKSQVRREALPAGVSPKDSLQMSGSREIKAEFAASEITASMNNQPWAYWPYKNVQVRFNADGSGEISGTLIKSRVPAYAAAIDIPQQAINVLMKFLPNDPAFYVKGKAALTDNKVSLFEPEAFSIGRMPMPVGMFLSFSPLFSPDLVFADETGDLSSQLSQIKDKRGLIIGYINSRLASKTGFYARSAYFSEDRLVFDGRLPEVVSVSQ
jgi:hypothetical protein